MKQFAFSMSDYDLLARGLFSLGYLQEMYSFGQGAYIKF